MGSIQSPVGTFVRTLSAIAEAKPADGAEAPSEEAKTETEAVVREDSIWLARSEMHSRVTVTRTSDKSCR